MRKNTYKKSVIVLTLICCLTVSLFCKSCRVNTRLQDEYTKTGLSQGMNSVFNEYRESIPKMMAEQKIPGLSIAVVDRNGILWTSGFGYTDKGKNTPVTPETIFWICSMSKTFAATAVMLATQDGLVELDEPIVTYLPDFMVMKEGFDALPMEPSGNFLNANRLFHIISVLNFRGNPNSSISLQMLWKIVVFREYCFSSSSTTVTMLCFALFQKGYFFVGR